jgi:hypothetical protein
MILPVIEVIFALLRLVGEVELGQLSKSAETQHGEGARQACHSATATLDCPFEQLTVDVFHILKYGDEVVLGSRAGDDSCLCQHVPTTSRLQLHFVHEVLNAMAIENAIAVDEEHEQVVVPAKIVFVDSVDETERLFLAVSLAAMRKTRDRDSTPAIGYVDAPWEGLECDRHTQFFDGPQVELVLILAVEREEDV